MKIELLLFTVLFLFSFDNFGQLTTAVTQRDTTTGVFLPYGAIGSTVSCITTHKKKDKIVFECYNKETQMLKTRIRTKSPISGKWDTQLRRTDWDENGEKNQSYVVREKYSKFDVGNTVPGQNSNVKEIKSVTWYVRRNGKLCLKRKEEKRSVIYPSN